MSPAPSETANKLPFEAGSGHSVPMTCREKGGSQAAFLKDVCDRMVIDLQNVFLGKRFGDFSRTQVGMLEFILNYFGFVFLCKSFGMRVNSMGSVPKAFYASVAFSESPKVTVDATEWNILFFTDLFGLFLTLQNGTDQFIPLNCIHSVASRVCL
jgi:hypothetical protein